MKESELGTHLAGWFRAMPGHQVYGEVQCAGIIDMVVKSGNILSAIECKMTFGLAVIDQAFKNMAYAHYSYVAVPKVTSSFGQHICKQHGIGILTVSMWGDEIRVDEIVKPRFNRRIVKPQLAEYQLLNVPGVQSDRWTGWSWFVETLQQQLRRSPAGMTHKELFDTCHRHYTKPSYLKNNVLTYIRSGLIKEVEYREGRFYHKPIHAQP